MNTFAIGIIIGISLLVSLSFFVIKGSILIAFSTILLLAIAFFVKIFFGNDTKPADGVKNAWGWVRQGLLYGCLLGIILIPYVFGALGLLPSSLRYFSDMLLPIGGLFAYGLAGFVSGQRSNTIKAGTFAGVLAAVTSSVMMISSLLIITLLFISTIRYNTLHSQEFLNGGETVDQIILGDNVVAAIFSILSLLVYGGAFGTIGSLVGKSTHRNLQVAPE